MKWSKAYIYTLKESPADAEIPSHKLLVRGGYIRKVGQGVYTYGPLILRSLRKLEKIIRDEHDRADCVELLMPMVQPRELWDETGRWDEMGKGLLKFRNRLNQDWCLGATHEEVITDFVRKDIKSYRDLPKTLYQIQAKYRDEIRPRFGLMRGREFLMKDAYSFDADKEEALISYERMYQLYNRIFSRLGVEFRVVDADSGNIGGDKSQEFHVLAESGEDHLLVSEADDFAANAEVCPAIDVEPFTSQETEKKIEEFETPGLKTIACLAKSLNMEEKNLVKTMFFSASDDETKVIPIAVLLRGSDEVNPIKLKNILGLTNPPLMLSDQEVTKLTGADPGSCGPVGLAIPTYIDTGLSGLKNYIVGANKNGKHLRNVNHHRDFKVTAIADVRLAKEGDKNPHGDGVLKSYRGIEVGHIFNLGTKYSKAMSANFLNQNGQAMPLEMGCYGIGVSRTLQASVEQNHDEDGIVWPIALAPYTVHICLLDPRDEASVSVANEIYSALWSKGIDCLMDDRNERPGVKFKDADLLGMPLRLTIGGRGIANNELEIVERKTKTKFTASIENTVNEILKWVEAEQK